MAPRQPTLTQAARQLKIPPHELLAELRRRDVIDADNAARLSPVANGYFDIEQRQHAMGETCRYRNYYITTVTDKGFAFLREVANALRGAARIHGSDGADRATAEREPAAVSGSDRAGAVCGVSQ